MADPNLVDFYTRVSRFEKARSRGYGFEAPGTIGRSYYQKKSRSRRSLLGPLLMLCVCGFGLKGMIYHAVGSQSYNTRVERLLEGEGFDHLGGWMMQADPVTQYISSKITVGLSYLNKPI